MIYRLTRCAYDSTPGLVDTRVWPWSGHRVEFETLRDRIWRANAVTSMIADGTLVKHEDDEAAWREHFGILAEAFA